MSLHALGSDNHKMAHKMWTEGSSFPEWGVLTTVREREESRICSHHRTTVEEQQTPVKTVTPVTHIPLQIF